MHQHPSRDQQLPSTLTPLSTLERSSSTTTTADAPFYHAIADPLVPLQQLQAPPRTQITSQAPAQHNPVTTTVRALEQRQQPVCLHHQPVRRFPSTTSSSGYSVSTTASTASSSSAPASAFASFLAKARSNRNRRPSDANMPSRSRAAAAAAAAVSPAEYAALPPSIQKKYFSSSERLHIAQQAAVQSRQKQSPAASPRQSHDGDVSSSSPACTPSSSVRVPRPLARPRAASVSSLEPMQDVISEDQAFWFLTLPDKIRRQRFSKDELATLTTRCETVLHHASPDSPVKIAYSHHFAGQPSAASAATAHSNHRKQFSFDCPKRSASDPALEPAQPIRQPSSDWEKANKSAYADMSSHSADTRTMKKFPNTNKVVRPQQSTPTVYVSPQPVSEPVAPLPLKAHYRPVRRKSLTPIALPPPTLSPAPPVPSPSPPVRSWTSPEKPELARPRTAPSVPELSAQPVSPRKAGNHDDARRNRQAPSDEKETYVEAMNFGFPMPGFSRSPRFASNIVELPAEVPFELAGDLPVSSHPVHGLPPRRSSAFENSDTEDDTTSLSTRGPLTPSHAFEGSAFREFQKASIDSGVALPQPHPLAKSSTPTLAEIPFTKIQPESVLRISRSRPELRELPGSHPVQYAEDPYRNAQTNHDPLKLQSLQVIEGNAGAFAVKSDDSSTIHSNKSGFLRFLKKF